MKKRITKRAASLTLCLVLVSAFCLLGGISGVAAPVFADEPTDIIRDYEVTVDVNEDATLNLNYHFEWEVLESDGIGPVSWLKIGIPNGAYRDYAALSENISEIYPYMDSGMHMMRLDFDRNYYEGEVISFDFSVTQDYMYQMNAYEEGLTSYIFTPGWFDEVEVEKLVIRWNAESAANWTPAGLVQDGYVTWEDHLQPGGTFTVRVDYPNDAFAFDEQKYTLDGNYNGYIDDTGYWVEDDYYGDYDDSDDLVDTIIGAAGLIFLILVIGGGKSQLNQFAYSRGSGMKSNRTRKMVTRTIVEYWEKCQGCGAPRGENETKCPYCGRSFIKKESKFTEEEIPEPDREEILSKKTNGEYRCSSAPNKYVRVNVVNVPTTHGHTPTSRLGGSRGGGSRGGGRSSGGCAHSSCACAHSCACACACACAGGGRAGCSTKDFYNTNLKLKQLELKNRR